MTPLQVAIEALERVSSVPARSLVTEDTRLMIRAALARIRELEAQTADVLEQIDPSIAPPQGRVLTGTAKFPPAAEPAKEDKPDIDERLRAFVVISEALSEMSSDVAKVNVVKAVAIIHEILNEQ